MRHPPFGESPNPLARADALTAEAGFLLFDHAPGRAELALRDADAAYETILPEPEDARAVAVFHALTHRRLAEIHQHSGDAGAGIRELARSLSLLQAGPTRGPAGAWALAVRGAVHGLRAELERTRFDLIASRRDWAIAAREGEAAARRWPALDFARADAIAARTQLAFSAVWSSRLRDADRQLDRALRAVGPGWSRADAGIRPALSVARTLLLVARLRVLELRLDLALGLYRDSEHAFSRTLARQPGSPAVRAEMAEALVGQAVIVALRGRSRRARRRFDLALDRAREAVAMAPRRPELWSTLTRVLLVRSGMAQAFEPAESPLVAATAALAAGRRCVRFGESNLRHRRDLANALRRVGQIEGRSPGRRGRALRHLNEAASILGGIVRENPKDAPSRARLAVVLSDLISVEPDSGRPRRARDLFERAVGEMNTFAAYFPTGFLVPGLLGYVRRAYAVSAAAGLPPRARLIELERSRDAYASARARAPGYLPALWGVRDVSALLATTDGRTAAGRRRDRATVAAVDDVLRRAGIRPRETFDELDPAGGFLGLAMR